MTILQSGISLPIALNAGQTIVLKELSGVATVTGGSAAREDASARIGAGFVIYGPQASAATVMLSTTGFVDYQVVNGDPTPANQPVLYGVDPSGPTLSPDAAGVVRGQSNLFVPRKMVILGDSRIANYANSGGLLRCSTSFVNQFQALTNQSFEVVYQGGVSGDTAAQVAVRVPIAIAAALAAGAQEALVHVGVNDMRNDGGGAAVADTIINQIFVPLLNAGLNVRYPLEEGGDENYGSVDIGGGIIYSWNAARAKQTAILNAKISAWAAGKPNVDIINFESVIRDRTSAVTKNIIGIKRDSIHDAQGGADVKAEYLVRTRGAQYPRPDVRVIPSRDIYSGDPAFPLQLLDNPGFTAKTGGVLTGRTDPTIPAWSSGAAIAAGPITNGGNIYRADVAIPGGTTVAPTHTGYREKQNGLTYWGPAASAAPAGWGMLASSTRKVASVNVVPNDANGNDVIILVNFSARGEIFSFGAGTDYPISPETSATLLARFVVGANYKFEATLSNEWHNALAQLQIQWSHAGIDAADGILNGANYDQDTKGNSCMQLCTFPQELRRSTPAQPFLTGETFSMFNVHVQAAAAGWAFIRVRDARVIKVA